MSGDEKLIKADIRLQCTDANHKGTCLKLRDSLLDNYNEILEAQITRTVHGSPDFCVTAIAMIHPTKKSQFEKSLKNLDKTSKTISKVRDVKIQLAK